MSGPAPTPLAFLDVDGPLLPFGGESGSYPAPSEDARKAAAAHPLLHRLDPAHGPRLAALPCDLIWATTWMADANALLAPLLGLPPLPIVTWPDDPDTERADERAGLHWKTRGLVTRAAGRPFAWIDDEPTARDRAWVAAHHPAPALLHRVDPRRGLTPSDYRTLRTWLLNPR